MTKGKNETNHKMNSTYISKGYEYFFNEIRFPVAYVESARECFPIDIVITPCIIDNIHHLFDAINSGIQSKFLNHSQFLIDLMSKEISLGMAQILVDEVVDGNLKVGVAHNTTNKDRNTNRFILFSSRLNGGQVLALRFIN